MYNWRWMAKALAVPTMTLLLLGSGAVCAQLAGQRVTDELLIAEGGRTAAAAVVSPEAGRWEKRAAADLVKYIQLMTGAAPELAENAAAIGEGPTHHCAIGLGRRASVLRKLAAIMDLELAVVG